MLDNNKSYRIRTNVGEDSVLNVNINQDFNVLEVLSLKISTDNLYKLHTSDYGCIAGRVLANGGYGIPNAKVSIFIAAEGEDLEDDILTYLYPYKTVNSKNSNKIRYNLLPEDQLSDCHRNVGTFPSKRTVLDDNNVLEIYDKYYKFTTRTNESGDYMIFGVPTGSQTLHVDLDLSDIGMLSQRPRDMVYKGYNVTQFENANMFKKSEDLDSLAQIFSQNQNVYVYPFWGEESEGDIAITRRDIEVQYEFTPTCVFIGSLITDEGSNGISKRCVPSERMGKMDRLVTGNGTIEMIRKTPDGSVEEFIIQGNALIDGDGVWCYQIPMNLDYVKTDEFGNIVRTDDITKGIPTRASVRFRFSLTEFENEGGLTHVAKVLVPNNPKYYTNKERTAAGLDENDRKQTPILDYAFGSLTDDASFKDLFSNNVYTVKSFIPRFQMLNLDRNKRFSGIKAVNDNGANNPIPYNNIRVDLSFMFILQCAVFKVLLWVIGVYNNFLSHLYHIESNSFAREVKESIQRALKTNGKCIYIGEGYCPEMEGWYFAPRCWEDVIFKGTYRSLKVKDNGTNVQSEGAVVDNKSIDYSNADDGDTGGRFCLTRKMDYFVQCVEINLAMEHNVIQFDFYNDWINGLLYVPRWMADMRPKRTFLFGLFRVRSRINACLESGYRAIFSRRYAQQCALTYGPSTDGSYTDIKTVNGCKNNTKQKCHKSNGRKTVKILSTGVNGCKPGGGIVHEEYTIQNKYAYYFRPCEWMSGGRKCNLFATDIILLGSMEKGNTQGIPQTFKKLQSSTFNLPDTLASTNLGVNGRLYGSLNDSGTICNEATNDAPEPLPSSQSSVIAWTKGKDVQEQDPYDSGEDIVTEAAGIDWGYTGPGQDKSGSEVGIGKLYYPGGHFLGVSCFNSETNIKSCINLSRICEAGAMISQRQMFIVPTKKNGSLDGGMQQKFLVPTGLISNNEINDYGLRNEFATLNHNNLKTKLNNDTLLREYVFETVYPISFDGSLSKKILNVQAYNEVVNENDKKITIEENSTDYYRFRFGLPKDFTRDDAKKKYLISSNTSASLPVYENSFYFYFGLKSGSTSLDKFYKNFYAECPPMKKYEPEVNIIINNHATLCEDNGEVSVAVKNIESPIITIESNEKVNDKIIRETVSGDSSTTFSGLPGGIAYTITVEGENGVSIINSLTIEKDFPKSFERLSYDVIPYSAEIEVLVDTDEKCGKFVFNGYENLFGDTNILALVVYLNNEAIKKDGKLYAKWYLNSYSGTIPERISAANDLLNETFACLSSSYTGDIRESTVTAWKGNDNYVIEVIYDCGDVIKYWECKQCGYITESTEEPTYRCERCHAIDWEPLPSYNFKEQELATEYISMPEDYNIIFDNYEFASYKYLIKPMFDRYGFDERYNRIIEEDWFNALFNNEHASGIEWQLWKTVSTQPVFDGDEGKRKLTEAIYHLRRALFYRNSQASITEANGCIPITITGGGTAYDFNDIIRGVGEQMVDTDDGTVINLSRVGSASELANSGFSMDVNEFTVPTNNTYVRNEVYPVEASECPRTKDYFYDYFRDDNKSLYRIKINDSFEFYLPSIYRPFFFRALYVSRINSETDYGQHYENVIVNPISLNTYGSSMALVKQLHEEHTKDGGTDSRSVVNGYQYSLANSPIPEKLYTYRHVSGHTSQLVTNGTYTVSVKEGYTKNGSEETFDEERALTLGCHFFGDGNGYDQSVKYYPIGTSLANFLYTYNGGTWNGATVMDNSGGTEYMNYLFPSSTGHTEFVSGHFLSNFYYHECGFVVPKSGSNGGYLWNPFMSAMLKETETIPGRDGIRFGVLSSKKLNGGNLNYCYYHRGEISPSLIISYMNDPTNESLKYALKTRFEYEKDEYLWGCVGIAEIPYDYKDEFGEEITTEESLYTIKLSTDFITYIENPTSKFYSLSPRHTSTLTVMRLYSMDAFLALAAHPNLKYNDPNVWG